MKNKELFEDEEVIEEVNGDIIDEPVQPVKKKGLFKSIFDGIKAFNADHPIVAKTIEILITFGGGIAAGMQIEKKINKPNIKMAEPTFIGNDIQPETFEIPETPDVSEVEDSIEEA